jgi:hypothetical protein
MIDPVPLPSVGGLIDALDRLTKALQAQAGDSIILSPDEVVNITGYRRAGDQLKELRSQGFHRARRSVATGDVILERAHYLAVAEGPRGRGRRTTRPEPELNWES